MRRRAILVEAASLLLCWVGAAAALAAEAPRTILVIGDSQAQGLAGGLQRLCRRSKLCHVLDRSKIGSGLISHTYEWVANVHSVATQDHADFAVAMFGANDRPPVRINGRIDATMMANFYKVYSARACAIAEGLRALKLPMIWVGHPIVRDPQYTEDMGALNRIYAECANTEGAEYLSTWEMFAQPDGTYTPYGKDLTGETTRLRADDGIHLTAAGYDLLAARLLPMIDATTPAAAPANP